MYAVVRAGGRQVRVREGEVVPVDLRAQLEEGAEVVLDEVLMGGEEGGDVKVGKPLLDGAKVQAVVARNEAKGPKVQGMKRRLVSTSKTKWGHRQRYTLLKINSIQIP